MPFDKITEDLAVVKSNGTFSGTFTTSVSGMTISYGDGDTETSNTPSHTFTDNPPYLVNTKNISDLSITGIAISGSVDSISIKPYSNLNSLTVTGTRLSASKINDLLQQLDELGTSNGTFDASGYFQDDTINTTLVNSLSGKGWTFKGFWTPAEISTVGWYDANDSSTITVNSGSVSQWDDKSGNGNHMEQGSFGNQPEWGQGAQINGLNVMHFTSTFDNMSKTGVSVDVSEGAILSVVESKQPGDYPSGGWVESTDASDLLFCRMQCNDTQGSTACVVDADGTGGGISTSNTADLRDDIPFIVSLFYDGSDGVARVNGGVQTATNTSPTDGATFSINTIGCGRRSSGGNTPRNYHGEMIVIPTSDLTTIQKAEGYLAWKWGTQSKLPSSHPYKNYAP